MDFDLSEEQEMLVDTVSKFVKNDSPVERFRKLRETEQTWEASVWSAMGEYGWLGVCFPEEQGGFGGRFVDAALILEQLGRGLVPEPLIPWQTRVSRQEFLGKFPTTYVVLRRDKALRAGLQRAYAESLNGATVTELDAGHGVLLSHPAQVAKLILG